MRQIKPGDDCRSIFDFVSSSDARHAVSTCKGSRIEESVDGQLPESGALSYLMYNDTDAAEDEVLFAGGRDQGLYKEITNPVVMFENSRIPPKMLARGAQLLDGVEISEDENGVVGDTLIAAAQTSMMLSHGGEQGASQFIHSVPPIWRQAYFDINWKAGTHGEVREKMLDSLDFSSQKLEMTGHDLQKLEWLDLMERDRSYGASNPSKHHRENVQLLTEGCRHRLQGVFPFGRPRARGSRKIRRVNQNHSWCSKLPISQRRGHRLGLVLSEESSTCSTFRFGTMNMWKTRYAICLAASVSRTRHHPGVCDDGLVLPGSGNHQNC